MMANPWFRLYSEFAHDTKVQMLPEVMQRRYVMLMCLRCSESLASVTDEEVAFALRISEQELLATKQIFMQRGFIDEQWQLLNWQKRQFESDKSSSRVQKYRDKRKAMGLTSNGYTKHSDTVMARDGHACVYCAATEKLCIDHVKPVTQGGTDDLPNLVTACKACNSGKAGRTPEQAGYSWVNKAAEKEWKTWCNSYGNAPEQNRTEQKQTKRAESYDSLFDVFWASYPKKAGKDAARKAFAKRSPDESLTDKMIEAVALQKQSDSWLKDGGQYIPHPATWLNQGRWMDEIDGGLPVSSFAGGI